MFALAGLAGADDTKSLVVLFRPHDKNEAASDRPDGYEAILGFGVCLIEDLEVVGARSEKLSSLLERDAVLALVREVLGFIPCNPHLGSVGC